MRIVHLSDLHLGFRQYQRLTPAGINQREADVAQAFRAAIDRTIRLDPQVVLVGGDVFHTVRPSNPAILDAFNQFARLRRELPHTSVVFVAGNHDLPRASETGCILRLFSQLGIHVVDGEPRRVALPQHQLSVLAVPYTLGQRPPLEPDPAARYNVLLIHGEVAGVLPVSLLRDDRAGTEITLQELAPKRWDYIALGHYHVYHKVAENAYYSGAIEYTSTNTWSELAELPEKGLIEHDLESGKHTFHQLPMARLFLDLPATPVEGLSAPEVDRVIANAVARVDLGGNVVRLMLTELPRHISRDLNHAALREYRRRALHFHLDVRRPETIRLVGSAAPGQRPSLVDIVRQKLSTRLIESDIDRGALVSLGLKYLSDAEAVEVVS